MGYNENVVKVEDVRKVADELKDYAACDFTAKELLQLRIEGYTDEYYPRLLDAATSGVEAFAKAFAEIADYVEYLVKTDKECNMSVTRLRVVALAVVFHSLYIEYKEKTAVFGAETAMLIKAAMRSYIWVLHEYYPNDAWLWDNLAKDIGIGSHY